VEGGVSTLAGVKLAAMRADDWLAVREIYAEGIATGNATFETETPSFERWDATHLAGHRLVAWLEGAIVGWAALARVSERCVYRGVAENSVYVAAQVRGLGIGYRLLAALVAAAEDDGIWTIQTGVFPDNTASLALHERCGFRVVGRRERLGPLHGIWRDVIFLERRSSVL
jgi:L-amino acid N-acyltransferase YncA